VRFGVLISVPSMHLVFPLSSSSILNVLALLACKIYAMHAYIEIMQCIHGDVIFKENISYTLPLVTYLYQDNDMICAAKLS